MNVEKRRVYYKDVEFVLYISWGGVLLCFFGGRREGVIIQYHTAFYVPYKEYKDNIYINTQERHVSVGTLFYLPCLIRDY